MCVCMCVRARVWCVRARVCVLGVVVLPCTVHWPIQPGVTGTWFREADDSGVFYFQSRYIQVVKKHLSVALRECVYT